MESRLYDPMSFLEMYTTGNAQNKVHYANPAYDDLIKSKTEVDVQARWDALLQAENNCLKMQRLLRYINLEKHIYNVAQLLAY